jgi:parvulin-like peptidyl-prolyl isomerase
MAFQQGHKKVGGRRAGTPNKATSSLRNWVRLFVTRNAKQAQRDLDALDPKDRLIMLEKFMRYTIPQQQSVSAAVDLNRLSDDQLDQVIEQIAANVMQDGN